MSTVADRIAAASTSVEVNLRAAEFLAIARALAATSTDAAAERYPRARPVHDRVIEAFNLRAAQPAGLTTDSTWAIGRELIGAKP